jgi:hypothetical protein
VCTGYWCRSLREKNRSEDPDIDGRILGWMSRKYYGGMDWIDLARDRKRLRAHVNTVMNLWVPYTT